jgi:nicotinate-nucleotide pyrophosphorylase (carboxylating)
MEFFDELIRTAFREDFAHRDITTTSCVEPRDCTARIVLKQPGCIAGLKFIPRIFELFDPQIETQLFVPEGQLSNPGTIAELKGPARSILSAERVALNFLQHLCGIATLTSRCVALVQGTSCQILDTRKTLPGLRSLQKYAVKTGGGTNHRLHLADRILIKNNHLALNSDNLFACVEKARLLHPEHWIEIEVQSPEQFQSALPTSADAFLLDNMTPAQIRQCVLLNNRKAYLEASGGIAFDTLLSYAKTGVNGISMGALTHSAPALDISLRIVDEPILR